MASTDEAQAKKNKAALQQAFKALMQSKPEDIQQQATQLITQAKQEGASFAAAGTESSSGKTLSDLMLRLDSQFPADIGLFVTFFLNYIQLSVGEAMFLKAGDINECMASSDNVVRAGFTPKFKDVDTLTEMLT